MPPIGPDSKWEKLNDDEWEAWGMEAFQRESDEMQRQTAAQIRRNGRWDRSNGRWE